MKSCIICGDRVEGRFDYCKECFQTKINELDMKYRKQKGPFTPCMDIEEAPASEPLTENTHH